ncbi:MAG: hypothetical protein ACRDX9_12705 [Acidimicrobiia bacterium]
MKVPLLSSVPLLAALIWAGAFVVDPGPLAPGSVLLMAIGLLGVTTVGLVGMTVTGGRWAHRVCLGSVGAMAVLAVIRPIDTIWVIALVVTVLAGVAILSPALTGARRKLPPATSPPLRAVMIPLLLIALPYLLGLAAWDQPSAGTMVAGLSAPMAALWYARVLPGGLYVVRVIWPALAIGLAFTQWLSPALVSALSGLVIAILAWHSTVKVAFHPPREVGSVYPIPPELAPGEVLDSANLDERGRPRR